MSASPPAPASRSPLVTLASVATVAVLLLATATVAAAVPAVPSRVLPAATEGTEEVVLRPAVLRAVAGSAQVEVALGAAAAGDVVVDLSLAEPAVSPDGRVTPGAPAEVGRITRGGRIRPGEVLRAAVSEVSNPLVVVATVRPAGAAPATDTTDASAPSGTAPLAAVVLPEDVGPTPTVRVEVVDGELRGTVTTTTPMLVTARLSGARTVTHPDRLVLPDQPLVLTGEPVRWPAPSELTVTDEAGRTAVATTSRTALLALAVALVLAAATVGLLVHRQRRATGD